MVITYNAAKLVLWEVIFINIYRERIIRTYIACIFEMLILMFSMKVAAVNITPISKAEIYGAETAFRTNKKTVAGVFMNENKHRITAEALSVDPIARRKSSKAVTTIKNLMQREKELAASKNAVSNNGGPKETKKSETYYDTLTAEEISLIEVTIQHEVGELSKTYKRLIAELLYNRLKSDIYPDTVKEMLYQENQFIGIESWYYPNYPVDDETKAVVKEVFSKDSTTHQALTYYNPALTSEDVAIWFEYSGDVQFLFDYSEESWGVVYTMRFFK